MSVAQYGRNNCVANVASSSNCETKAELMDFLACRKYFEKLIAHEFATASIRVPSSDNGNHLQVQRAVQKRKMFTANTVTC